MKKVLSTLFSVALVASMATAFVACGGKKSKTQILTIGVTNYEPLNYKENGKWVGFETELAEAVCQELGYKPVFKEINWDNKLVELNSGEIDCIWNGMTVNAERQKAMDLSIAYLENKQVAVVKKENSEIFKTKDSFKNAKITAEKGSAGQDVAKTLNANFTSSESQIKSLTPVKSGDFDATIIDSLMAKRLITSDTSFKELTIADAELTNKADIEDFAIAFKKGSELPAKVNAVIVRFSKNGTLQKIAKKYNLENAIKEL